MFASQTLALAVGLAEGVFGAAVGPRVGAPVGATVGAVVGDVVVVGEAVEQFKSDPTGICSVVVAVVSNFVLFVPCRFVVKREVW